MSIVTVTLNPAIDQTISVNHLHIGEVHRAQSVHYTAGGKGIMVASCLADWHAEPIIVTGLLGNHNAVLVKSAFQQKNIQDKFVQVAGANRTNIKIVDPSDTTDINLPGISATAEALNQLLQFLETPCDIAVLSGSLPLNCANDVYVRMLSVLQKHDAKVILDASGEALREALKAEIKPYCIKPNMAELSDWVGRLLNSQDDVICEARQLITSGIQLVVISMGAEGALFIDSEQVIKASLKANTILTTVGAGDAMVAGIATALREGLSLEATARLSSAFAVAKLGFIGPDLPERKVVEILASQVVIEQLEG